MPSRLVRALGTVAVLAALWSPAPAAADQTDPVLDDLFARLRATQSTLEARGIEQEIWATWFRYDGEARGVNQWMRLGDLWSSAGDRLQAYHFFVLVTQADPEFAEGWNRLATMAYLLGDYSASLAAIDEVLALEPRHFGALSGMGLVLMALQRPEEAITAFERTLEVNPHAMGARENLEQLRLRVEGAPI